MEEMKVVKAAADYNLLKCRYIETVSKWRIPKEEIILEDDVPNKDDENGVEESRNNSTENEQLSNIKTEEYTLEYIEEEDLGKERLYSSDYTECKDTAEEDKMLLKDDLMEQLNATAHNIENIDPGFYLSVPNWNEELIPGGQLLENVKRIIEKRTKAQDEKPYRDGRLVKGNPKLTKRKRNFLLHSQENRKKKLLQCDYCKLKFKRNQKLQHHIEEVHFKLKPLKCEYCEYTCSRNGNMKAHTRAVHLKLKTYKCDLCDYIGSQSTTVKEHIRAVHLKLKPYKCEYCDYIGSTSGTIKTHTRAVHLKLKPYKCEYCDYTSAIDGYMKKHTRAVHLKLKTYKCEYCDYTCSQSGTIKTHTTAVHLKLKPYKCEYCDYTGSQRGTMKSHIRTVHLKLKPYKCEYCDYTFLHKSHLKNHITNNSKCAKAAKKGKLFKCEICKFSSAIHKDILLHKDEMHKKSETFKCTDCKLNFIDRNEYLSHKEKNSFICVDCDSRFCKKKHLIEHMELCINSLYYNSDIHENISLQKNGIHKKIEKLMCTDCKLNFIDRNGYLSHERSKQFMCVDCDSRFCEKKHLIDHMDLCPNSPYYHCK